ncbi:T9SS-dependent choice-of-anchor J family protein [Aequorivita marina]|uniref:T9SS-dependent choice-of-anchor J family protein n=1 Tax=Aequorivita marina TaxID=3073654 RepID=UPI0028751AC6|nr:choice-of-anchor J domain-containing protein [Aequorivita sp. S2608]MDS1297200.1 choice-of-anchor J domain-containing protein [Aequorivita sp. S2608]
MIKKITLFFALAFIHNANSQIFNSGFENNNGTPLSEYTTANNDGLMVPIFAPVQDFNTEAWIQFYDGYDNKIAFSTSWYEPAGQSDDWLITPAIEIPNNGEPTLYWKGKSYDFENLEDYDIRVSTTTNDISSFTETILSVEGEQPFDFNSRSLDLSTYKGQTIYLAFVNVTDNGLFLALDDLYISETSNCELPDVTGVSIENLTEDSFTVTWTPTAGITTYDTGLATFTGSVSSTGTQDGFTKTYENLEPGTRYQFFLKNADCGSGWATPVSIWTAAIPPYAYDFEFTTENYGEYDSDGWSSNTWINGFGAEAQNGDGYVFNNTSTSFDKNDWIHSYPIKMAADETIKITYFAKLGLEPADPATLKVAVADEPNRDANFMELDSQTIPGGDYLEYTTLFTATEDGVYYFGFGNVTPIVIQSSALRLDNIQFSLEPLSVDENSLSSISVFPNPVKDVLTIKSVESIESSRLYTINGKLIAEYSNQKEIDFTAFPKGLYLLKITTNKGTEVKKIIK